MHPEVTVGALVFNKGKLLLVKSHKWSNMWVMPGGHIKYGERAKDALKREIKEETGLTISKIKFLGWVEYILGKTFYKKKHFVCLDFVCKADSRKVKLNKEAEEFIWISPKEALKLNLEPLTKKPILYYIEKIDINAIY